MSKVEELLEQVKEWERQRDMLEDKIEEYYTRIDELTEEGQHVA